MKPQVRFAPILLICFLAATCASVLAGENTEAVGPGSGTLSTRDEEPPCGYLFLNSDQVYENGYAWRYMGVAPPFYGAFAECFPRPGIEVCAVTFDLTQLGSQGDRTFDAYLWDDDGGIPGSILCVVTGVDPGPIAYWPSVSRHTVPLSPSCFPDRPFWAGHWGNWPLQGTAWFVAADVEGEGQSQGCPMTNIAGGIGYPTGWQSVDVVWGPTRAMGIGIIGHSVYPVDVEDGEPAIEVGSWGRVKALYY